MTITCGPDWLNHPDVIRLREMHGLAHVKTQLVGPRASFEGKAYGFQGLIRMPDNRRHPTLWLLTYLHELAHILDDEDRLRRFEREHGRKARKTREDFRRLHRLGRAHGPRWTAAFVALAETACTLGLFPGNEQPVLQHAQSGRARTISAALDLTADARVKPACVEPLPEPSDTLHAVQFTCGDRVSFDTGPRRHGRLQGTILKVNRNTCTVETKRGRWRVSFDLLKPR